MLDEGLPGRGRLGDHEACVEGRIRVEGLPGGADDVPTAL